MVPDVFGDLKETREVLDIIEYLRNSGRLDDHQYGLARILRFKEDPQLQEAAIDCLNAIGCASDVLITDTLNLVVTPETPVLLRVTAVRALGRLVPRYTRTATSELDPGHVYQTMRNLAARPQPPILGGALALTLDQLAPQIRRALLARPPAAGALPIP